MQDPQPQLNLQNISHNIKPNAHKTRILQSFGDPQIVERNMYGREVWIYDKMFVMKKHDESGLEFFDIRGSEYLLGAGIGFVAVNLLWNSLNFKDRFQGLGSLVGAAIGATSVALLKGDFDKTTVGSRKR